MIFTSDSWKLCVIKHLKYIPICNCAGYIGWAGGVGQFRCGMVDVTAALASPAVENRLCIYHSIIWGQEFISVNSSRYG